MTEHSEELLNILSEKLAELGPEFLIANEIPRTWSTAAQAFVNGPFTMMVFREQSFVNRSDGSSVLVARNVASIVMPTEAAAEFHQLLGEGLRAVGHDPE